MSIDMYKRLSYDKIIARFDKMAEELKDVEKCLEKDFGYEQSMGFRETERNLTKLKELFQEHCIKRCRVSIVFKG